MLDIEGADKKVKAFDKLLTDVKSLLRKHWLILIVLTIIVGAYFSWDSNPLSPASSTKTETDTTIVRKHVIEYVDTVYVTDSIQ